jgi:hypothetical protein
MKFHRDGESPNPSPVDNNASWAAGSLVEGFEDGGKYTVEIILDTKEEERLAKKKPAPLLSTPSTTAVTGKKPDYLTAELKGKFVL